MQKPFKRPTTFFGFRRYKFILSVIGLTLFSCGVAAAAIPGPQRMLAPNWFGFNQVAANIYAPASMDAKRLAKLLREIEQAGTDIAIFHQRPLNSPRIVLCPSTSCNTAFGPSKVLGTAYGSYIIRLNDKGLNRTIATHELSHIALKKRAGDVRVFFSAIPAWFDEGLAVLLSNDERFNRKFPPSAATYMRKTGDYRTWGKSVKKLGWKNAYGGSMELVRGIRNQVGDKGLLEILDRVGEGEEFEMVMEKVMSR